MKVRIANIFKMPKKGKISLRVCGVCLPPGLFKLTKNVIGFMEKPLVFRNYIPYQET